MNCSQIDKHVIHAYEFTTERALGISLLLAAVVLLSTFLLFRGARYGRTLGTASCVLGGSAGIFILTMGNGWSCLPRLVAIGAGGLVGGLLAACCTRRVGAAALCATACGMVADVLYESVLPSSLQEQDWMYGTVLSGAAFIGILLSCWQTMWLARAVTSAMAGCGYAFSLHFGTSKAGASLPPVVLLILVALSTGAGLYVQPREARQHASEPPMTGPNPFSAAAEQPVPLGLPVATTIPP